MRDECERVRQRTLRQRRRMRRLGRWLQVHLPSGLHRTSVPGMFIFSFSLWKPPIALSVFIIIHLNTFCFPTQIQFTFLFLYKRRRIQICATRILAPVERLVSTLWASAVKLTTTAFARPTCRERTAHATGQLSHHRYLPPLRLPPPVSASFSLTHSFISSHLSPPPIIVMHHSLMAHARSSCHVTKLLFKRKK